MVEFQVPEDIAVTRGQRHPVADGIFRASPAYFGDHASAEGHQALLTRHGMAWLPIGCFLVRTGDRSILVDTGLGRRATIAPGVSLTMTPGHTPGHLCVIVSSAGRRAMLLGDAVVCPVQLDQPSWTSMGDVDRELAHKVRERLFREREDGETLGAGAHFPELQFGRVLVGQGRRWFT